MIRSRIAGDPPRAKLADVFLYYPECVRTVVKEIWLRETDPDVRIQQLRPLVAQTLGVSGAVDLWLEGPAHSEVHTTLVGSTRRALSGFLHPFQFQDHEVVVYPGKPDNFFTRHTSIDEALFAPLGPSCPQRPPELQHEFVLFQVPRHEGSNPLWRPVTLGHELAHVPAGHVDVLTNLNQLLGSLIDPAVASALPMPAGLHPAGTVGVTRVAANWLIELLCDAHAVLRFGPAGLASMAEFLDLVGAVGTTTHPPTWLRIECMRDWVGPVPPELQPIAAPYETLASEPPNVAPWEAFMVDVARRASADVLAIADAWNAARYDFTARANVTLALADQLNRGLPCGQLFDAGGDLVPVEEADIVNACWLTRDEPSATRPPAESLAAKALADLEFLQTWSDAGGELLVTLPAVPEEAAGSGVLHFSQIARRIRASGPEQLVVTPLLPPDIGGAAIDLRLGKSFIAFARTGTPSFDPLDEVDATALQRSVELDWGGRFVLHPNELVLAATLEYISLPADLSAQVITRSSFGRLGLLSATAIQVHPGFRGCLTLELANLSNVPLHLAPGQRIAQLVLHRVDGSRSPTALNKYDCPTGPQFSMIRDDGERQVLSALRSTH